MIINYVKNQKEHHKSESYYDEYKRLLEEHGIELDENTCYEVYIKHLPGFIK